MLNDPSDGDALSDQGRLKRDGSPSPSRASQRGLDGFVFFAADVQTGFGAFVAVYLTTQKWPQVDIGLILTIGSLVGLASQIPGGAIVDAARSTRRAAALAIIAIGASAFAIAAWPIFAMVLASRLVHAIASSVVGPAIAAISLSLVGRDAIAQRLGRNASFASIGSGVAAAGMGACGYYLSSRAIFFVAAAMVAPALIALYRIRAHEIDPARAHGGRNKHNLGVSASGLHPLFANRPLRLFAGCAFLFHLANAAMLPLAASMLTLRSSQSATILVATSIVVPQFIVAALSPGVGRKAQQWGRRPLLVLAFGALSIRGVLFAFVVNPELLVGVQFLDAISAAVLGVLVPLTVADISRGTGHFNLAQGVIGCAVGIGAAVSTAIVGYLNDRFGSQTAFVTLACIAAFGFVFVWMVMPETRPRGNSD